MERAGWAVAQAVWRRWSRRRVAVLCGPGNNGGDGFVAARLLAQRGWRVRLFLLGEREALRGDAALAARDWSGPIEPLSLAALEFGEIIIDALFGAGLTRPLEGMAREVITEAARRPLPLVAVDVPSGVRGDDGEVLGAAAQAAVTVTFFRKKPGHLLFPGRALCGEIEVADIGIPESVLDEIAPTLAENGPELWRALFPRPDVRSHKYSRGHALVIAGPMSGAARLASRAARRVGAGLATVMAPAETLALHRAGDAGTLVRDLVDFESVLADRRVNAVLLGPGGGVGEDLRHRVLAVLAVGKSCVLDADALTSFAGRHEDLFSALKNAALPAVLTPHEGEFIRLFGAMVDSSGSRLARARAAAYLCGAVVLLKGSDTVIAAPDGRAVICANAPADLATAGSGDVLAGLILGLLAQGMPAFAAASAGAWLHGEAGRLAGRGLIAEDLPEAVAKVMAASNL